MNTTYYNAIATTTRHGGCHHIRAVVCTAASPETNCTQYGNNYKPEGLMQKYNTNMRFSAFGYLLDGVQARQGGVLRARMKSVGPTIQTGSPRRANPAYEWSAADGTYVTNPDTADASATGVTNSGVVNYLNKFGFNGVNNNGLAYKGLTPLPSSITKPCVICAA